MEKQFRTIKQVVMAVTILAFALKSAAIPNVSAEGFRFAVSPMSQKIVLNPGESYSSTFSITDPGTETVDISYEIELNHFYVDENYNTVHEEYGNTGEILNWITIESPASGTLTPNNSDKIKFTINVPADAPAGGQYAAFTIVAHTATGNNTSNDDDNADEVGSAINEVFAIDHLLFVDITGDSVRQGEIADIGVPSFLLSGNITGTSSIKNVGTTHGTATYKLQVFPLFSNEEVYSNEEDPETHTILPDRTLYNETTWDQTPAIGIFNVVYTVEFEGVTTQVSKMVIKCPIWLLFIIIFAAVALVIWIVMRMRARSKKSRKTTETAKSE